MPAIDYQAGKVSSIGVQCSLQRASLNLGLHVPVLHIHILHNIDIDSVATNYRGKGMLALPHIAHLRRSRAIRTEVDTYPERARFWFRTQAR